MLSKQSCLPTSVQQRIQTDLYHYVPVNRQTENHTNKHGQSVERINKGKPTFVQTYSSIYNAAYLNSTIKMVGTAWDDTEPE